MHMLLYALSKISVFRPVCAFQREEFEQLHLTLDIVMQIK